MSCLPFPYHVGKIHPPPSGFWTSLICDCAQVDICVLHQDLHPTNSKRGEIVIKNVVAVVYVILLKICKLNVCLQLLNFY